MRFPRLFMGASLAVFSFLEPRISGACGTGDVVIRPAPVIRNVSLNAQQLLAEATQLDSQAMTKDTTAASLEKEASDDETRAAQMRTVAMGQSEAQREMILARADGLSAQAMVLRTQASQRRAEAIALRNRAKDLRMQASMMSHPMWRRGDVTF